MADRYHGFSLSSVCWGYRDIFAEALEGLLDQGSIGDARPEVTESFFRLMRCADQHHFDYVLKEFLGALNPTTAWLMDLPGIFADVTRTGYELAHDKLHYGITYFRTLGEGGFGDSPEHVRYLLTQLGRLRTVDADLAVAFLRGYRALSSQLTSDEIDVYVKHGLRAFHQNRKTGLRFMEGALKSSEMIIRSLTQEARLADMKSTMSALLQALVGYEVEIGDLGGLDSDALIERSTRVVCMNKWLYVPLRIRQFGSAAQNRNWYRLCTVVAAGALSLNSFPRIHGHPAFSTCADLVGDDTLRLNCFQIAEYLRVLTAIRRMWPGARRLIDLGIETEYRELPPGPSTASAADRLFFDLLRPDTVHDGGRAALASLRCVADASINAFDTEALLTDDVLATLAAAYPGLAHRSLRTFAFLPDFLYPGSVSQPPEDALIADLKDQMQRRRAAREQDEQGKDERSRAAKNEEQTIEASDESAEGVPAAYVYDEWSQDERDYYQNYCFVYEQGPPRRATRDLPAEILPLARRVRRVFEMLRPELTKEKSLSEGDTINVDRLTEFVVQRHQEPSPRVDFYEKPYHNRRDLATLILLDVSGSTGSEVESDPGPSQARLETIEVEKRAALILGHGLAALGDRFAICGFSGSGREQCEFFVYKDFDDLWNRETIGGVLAANPRSATRIGAALRHAGYRLSRIAARQRLILLITDGRPMDADYDPNTRYAQYDVRMACEENQRQAIHTFCISTDRNSLADMEIMFPEHRYAIVPDVHRLPRFLPRLYVRLTS